MGHARGVFRSCAPISTTETRARIWDPDVEGSYEEVLDDIALRGKLADLKSLWGVNVDKPQEQVLPRFVLLTIANEPNSKDRALQIGSDTLQDILRFTGLSEQAIYSVRHNALPAIYYNLQYEDGDEAPTSLAVIWRCPKLSEYLIGVARIQFKTRNCFAWLSCYKPDEMQQIVSHAMRNLDLLRIHPLYFLSFIYDNRFHIWTEWISISWRSIVEIETTTKMTHPRWMLPESNTERQSMLSDTDILLQQLHGSNIEICHSHNVLAFGMKFGQMALKTLAEVEDRRRDLECKPLSRRERDGLEDCFKVTLLRCDSMKDRLNELSERLSGQINVTFNLIAQRDSKINFAIAKLQAHDSRTVKGIAILTLSFLPATLVSTLWTTNLWTISGDRNWQVFLIVVVVLTGLVFACWWAFGQVSKKRDDKRWPATAKSEGLPPLF